MTKPRSRADWREMSAEDRREEGAPPLSCYLKNNRTYPYKVWDNTKKAWRISLVLLNSAIHLGSLHGETGVVSRAQRIKKSEFGGD